VAHHLRWRDAVDRLQIPLAVLVGVGAILVVAAGAAGAQDGGIVEIPLGTVVRTDPGAEVSLDSVAVPTELVGLECSVQSRSENNSSVHPGNDLVVTSGAESVVLSDVEGSPGKVTTATSTVTLGDDIAVTLIMGPDGVFSAGARAAIVLECIVPEPTITTTTSTTTTTIPTETTVSTTTTILVVVAPVSSVAPPTVAPPPTTIAGPPPPSSTAVLSATTSAPVTGPILAITGPGESLTLAIVGIAMLEIGLLMLGTRVVLSRRGREE
jgi:hypothetical protein